MRAPETRVTMIEGRRVLVTERQPPLPADIRLLLEGGYDAKGRKWTALHVTTQRQLRTGGTSAACYGQDHRLQDWLTGFHTGSDGVYRLLRLECCADCAAVCVRDVSIDLLPGMAIRRRPRHKDAVMGWYSGSRRNQRVYSTPALVRA